MSRKKVLITGGARGIGEALTRAFALSGYAVYIHCGKSVAEAEELCAELPEAYFLSADLALPESVAAVARFCPDPDVLINNAGVSLTGLFDKITPAAAREMYDTITIDTVGLAWQMCEDFVCAQNGVQKISDIPWGGGYTACKKEFENCLRKITQLGYGLVIIAHVERRIEKRADDSEVEILGPAIPKRAYEIVNQLVDIIGYIDITWDEEGNSERWLYTRKTPTIMAGSRFKYLEPKIKFGYNELVNAISDAIDKAEKLDGATVVDKSERIIEEALDYNAIRAEASALWKQLVGEGENANAEMAKTILKKVEMIFGRTMKLSEITEDQVDLFNLVVIEMRDLAKAS